jgi:hypothetical protein
VGLKSLWSDQPWQLISRWSSRHAHVKHTNLGQLCRLESLERAEGNQKIISLRLLKSSLLRENLSRKTLKALRDTVNVPPKGCKV